MSIRDNGDSSAASRLDDRADSRVRTSASVRDGIGIAGSNVMRFGSIGVMATVLGLCAAFGLAQANDDPANPDN